MRRSRGRWGGLVLLVLCVVAFGFRRAGRTSVGDAVPLSSDADGRRILESFTDHASPAMSIDLTALYGGEGRRALLDPADALPTWHRYPYAEAAALARYARTCRAEDAASIPGSTLSKALTWHRFECGQAPAPDDAFFEAAPFMHPSGHSFAALALATRGHAWGASHARLFHASELASLGIDDLSRASLHAIARGDHVVLDDRWLLVRAGPLSPVDGDVLWAFPRAEWDTHLATERLVLSARSRSPSCSAIATPALCWAARPSPSVTSSRVVVLLALVLLLAGSAVLLVGRVRMRRLADLDRALILRALTHELRTPATALALSLEPLRTAYDTLPESLQEPLLRASDDVERIKRVLAVSASWLSLHEPPGSASFELVRLPGISALFRGIVEGYGVEVAMVLPPDDLPFTTDPRWLGIAVKNLIDNAVAHGKAPLRVVIVRQRRTLLISVVDQGDTRTLSLGELTRAFRKGESSSGLGLGLAIVARIARALGGRLEHEGHPTTFRLAIADLGARWP